MNAGPATFARYDAASANAIEARWQQRWEQRGSFITPNPGQPGFERFKGRPKQYILDMFPYPSGVGLHVGHPLGYIATDIYARYLRAKGYCVLHAMGYDAFGLPAEQFAVEHGVHPRITTERNIATMRAQLKRLGLAHDPTRSVSTTDVAFYRWTQWIFLQIYHSWYDAEATNPAGSKGRARPIAELVREFESGRRALPAGCSGAWSQLSEDDRRAIIDGYRLAYLAEVPVNWCPALGTVLANEEVTADGRSERGNHPVYKRPLKQWMMRITAYAERLLDDLEPLAWPESTKLMQRNWIGRSEGAYIDFKASRDQGIEASGQRDVRTIRVFTTRPDTLFGATYMVLAPEHPLVDALTAEAWPKDALESWKGVPPAATPREAVAAYRRFAESRSEVQRQAEAKEKTGVFIGSYAINPATGKAIPIFIADYVLMGYGTGAIMAVPAHDQRDFEFAEAFGLPIHPVVRPDAEWIARHVSEFHEMTEDGLGANTSAKVFEAAGNEMYFRIVDAAFAGSGVCIHSANDEVSLNGLDTSDAKKRMIAWLEEHGHGQGTTNYKLRDWLFSRQRYWGEPFPIVYDEKDHPIALPESMLPVELPPLDDFTPAASDDPNAPPQPPLGRAQEWLTVEIDGRTYRRELNTMPQWAGSCWYYLRYLDPGNNEQFVNPEVERYWMLSRKRSMGVSPVRAEQDADEARSMGVPPVRTKQDADEARSMGVPPLRAEESAPPEGSSVDDPRRTSPPPSPEVARKRRYLPHWTKGGCTYSVTFCMHDSTLSELEQDLVFDACLHWHEKRMLVHAVVVMPDHVHMIVTPLRKAEGDEWHTPAELMHSIKSFTAKEIHKLRGTAGPLWQQEYFDRIIRDEEEFESQWQYLRRNPVEAGLASRPEEYRWLFCGSVEGSHRAWSGASEESAAGSHGRDAHAPDSGSHGRDAHAPGSGSHGRDAHAPGSGSHGRDAHAPDSGSHGRDAHAPGFDPAIHHLGGVDLYVGGVEHAVLHLLYARFWHKVLFDLGHVSTPEPFGRLFNQGYIQAFAYADERGVYVPAEEVEECDGRFYYKEKEVTRSYGKMGKSLKNALTPDDIFAEYGCDTLRLYEMYMGPLDQSKPWNTRDIIGSHRFLQRVWRNFIDPETGAWKVVEIPLSDDLRRSLHKTIAKVDEDMRSLHFNTAIAALIEFNNALVALDNLPREAAEPFVKMLAPLVPHLASELWERLGHDSDVMYEPFPVADAKWLVDEQVEIAVQIMGKLRGTIMAPNGADEATVVGIAKSNDRIASQLEGKTIRKVIYVPNRLLNFVAN